MILELLEYTFNKNDHSWMEYTKVNEYECNEICDNCNNKMEKIVFIQNKYGDVGLTTSLCPNCGYIKRTKNLYNSYISEHFSNKWLSLRNEEFMLDDSVFLELKPYININKTSVLDIGCGNGNRLLSFKNYGCAVHGVEPSISRSSTAKNNIGTGYITTSFAEDFLLESKTNYNLIYSFNVLQFVENPFHLLQLISDNLEEDGIFYLRVQRYDYSNFIHFSTMGVIRSFLSLYVLKDFIIENNLNILKYTKKPFLLILKKGKKINKKTIDYIDKEDKITFNEIEQNIEKNLLTVRNKLFNKIKFKEKLMSRKVSLNILTKKSILPVQIYCNTESIPIVLK